MLISKLIKKNIQFRGPKRTHHKGVFIVIHMSTSTSSSTSKQKKNNISTFKNIRTQHIDTCSKSMYTFKIKSISSQHRLLDTLIMKSVMQTVKTKKQIQVWHNTTKWMNVWNNDFARKCKRGVLTLVSLGCLGIPWLLPWNSNARNAQVMKMVNDNSF